LASLKEDPDNADLRDRLAEFLILHELDPREAVAQARIATELAPDSALYRQHLAEALAGVSDWSGAVAQCERALEPDPYNVTLREKLAQYRQRLKAERSVTSSRRH
jgi:predicted Zn-dependent protease